MDLGTFTLHSREGDEIYGVERATITLVSQDSIHVPMPLLGGMTCPVSGGFGLMFEVFAAEGPLRAWPSRQPDERWSPMASSALYWRACDYDPRRLPLDLRSLVGKILLIPVLSQDAPYTASGIIDTRNLPDGVYDNEAWVSLYGDSEALHGNKVTFLELPEPNRLRLRWEGVLPNMLAPGVHAQLRVDALFEFSTEELGSD